MGALSLTDLLEVWDSPSYQTSKFHLALQDKAQQVHICIKWHGWCKVILTRKWLTRRLWNSRSDNLSGIPEESLLASCHARRQESLTLQVCPGAITAVRYPCLLVLGPTGQWEHGHLFLIKGEWCEGWWVCVGVVSRREKPWEELQA
jgi:hypothetical protein